MEKEIDIHDFFPQQMPEEERRKLQLEAQKEWLKYGIDITGGKGTLTEEPFREEPEE